MASCDDKPVTAHHEHPSTDTINRILATIYGQCIGDAIGLLSEFLSKQETKEQYGPVAKVLEYKHKDLCKDAHRLSWKEGDWTDDSDQMILIMRSLVDCNGKVTPIDFATKLSEWIKHGYKELGDHAGLGLGTTTAKVTSNYEYLKDPHERARLVWERNGKKVAPNGAVMRTSIIGVHMYWSLDDVAKNAREIAKTTHYDPRCQASTVAVSVAIASMMQGKHKDRSGHFKVNDIIREAYDYASACLETDEEKKELVFYLKCKKIKTLKLDEPLKIGYTYKSMGTGFWALKQDNFRKAITKVMLQDPLSCVCGKSIFNQGVQPSNDCNVPCPTMSGDICGGHFRDINITKDQLIDILKSNVDELQQNLTVDVKATSA
ncbi:Hypothetical predicted protein [Mytilus galloprovincialis]|uniref:Uncharacterized protein n=1 Tax=Mytilus galloprovincialis TaxID=29158 RepID=A0A8B6FBK1_MYTGA|nr:Hypothetical predicted protein [Mytilus galloprovincialis]